MDKSEVQPSSCSDDDRSQNVNRIIPKTKGTKIWYEENLFGIRKRPNLSKGIKAAYWSCSHAGCNVTFKTAGMDTLDGFEWGRNKEHSHPSKTCGEVIRMEMLEKGRLKARNNTESIGRIIEDLEKEYLTKENFQSIQWNRANAKQAFHRERGKNLPKIPKSLEDYDRAEGCTVLKTGGK